MINSARLQFLTGNEASLIYEKCLDILSEKGVKVEYPKALDMLKKAGAMRSMKKPNMSALAETR